MNIKTLQRSARKKGLTIKEGYDPEFKERVYTVYDSNGAEVAQANDKRYLAMYIEQGAALWH